MILKLAPIVLVALSLATGVLFFVLRAAGLNSDNAGLVADTVCFRAGVLVYATWLLWRSRNE